MEKFVKLYFLVLIFFVFLPFELKAECSPHEICLKGLSEAVFSLSEDIQPITKRAVYDHWYILLRRDKLLFNAKMAAGGLDCSKADDLVYAPSGSPLGESYLGKYLSDGKRKYIFREKLEKIQGFNAKSFGGGGIKIENLESLITEHEEWLKSFSQTELEKLVKEYRLQFLRKCVHDESPQIESQYDKIIQEYKELSEFSDLFDEIKYECENVSPEMMSATRYETGIGRYTEQGVAESRFKILKDFAVAGCKPMELIDYLFREEKNSCNRYVEDIYEIVNPECVNNKNAAKANLCNGLHDYLANVFLENPTYDSYLRKFINILNEVKKSESEIDIPKLALKATDGDSIAAWRLISLLGHDEINTTMKIIREKLVKNGDYERFYLSRDLYTGDSTNREEEDFVFEGKIISKAPKFANMRDFYRLIKEKGRFEGEKLEGRYYHFIAGAFLACELKGKGHSSFRAKLAATGTGVAYEAYDFESHTHLIRNVRDAFRTRDQKQNLSSPNQFNNPYLGDKKSLEQYKMELVISLQKIGFSGDKLGSELIKQEEILGPIEQQWQNYSDRYDEYWKKESLWGKLKETPWKDSFENFYDDSKHHHDGGKLGDKMCQERLDNN